MNPLVPVLCAVAMLCAPRFATAGPADDAALEAAEVAGEHCANLSSRRPEEIVRANKVVADTLEKLQGAIDASQEPTLLYWRGILVQCLDRPETAIVDYEAFIASKGGDAMYASMVREAKARLNRLKGRKRGEGPAADHLRRAARIEGTLRLGVTLGPAWMGCTDDATLVHNVACVGGLNPSWRLGWSPRPDGEVRADLYFGGGPARIGASAVPGRLDVGLGLRGDLTIQPKVEALHPAALGAPFGTLGAGFRLRLVQSQSAGVRAGALRLGVDVISDMSPVIPWAGAPKYSTVDLLDPGTWTMRGLGGNVRVAGALEASRDWIIELSGSLSVSVSPQGWIVQSREGAPRWVHHDARATPAPQGEGCPEEGQGAGLYCEAVERMGALSGGLHIRGHGSWSLLRPLPGGAAAMGLQLDVGYERRTLGITDDAGARWCVPDEGSAADCANDADRRRVYSTEWNDLVATLSWVLRLSAAPR